MHKIKIVSFLLFLAFLHPDIYTQPRLELEPNDLRFRDIFTRIDSLKFINRGDALLTVDSIEYTKKDYYRFEFENNRQLPFTIPPDDSVTVYIILENFYNLSVLDTLDTLWVHNNGESGPERLRIRIDFFDDDFVTINCYVRDDLNQPLPGTALYYFYYGIYLIDSAVTAQDGYYSLVVPKGSYTVAAAKDGYRTLYNNNTPDPFFAPLVQLDSGQTTIINYNLPEITNTNLSVSGTVYDSVSGNIIDKGVVVVRKGTHTPSRGAINDSSVYAGFINPDGTYSIPVEKDTFYYVQSYSNYFLPGYYNENGSASVFWQNADSVFIGTNIFNRNLYLRQDLSYGGGSVLGNIILPPTEVTGFDGITLVARSVNNGNMYTYNFGKEDATFRVDNLPFGDYELIAQRVGLPNAISQPFTIDSINTSISGVTVTFGTTDIQDEILQLENYVLFQNYPNPFNPVTTISYSIPEAGMVSLKIYDLLGKEVASLVDDYLQPGVHSIEFRADKFSSGIYFYKLNAGNFSETKKLVLIK